MIKEKDSIEKHRESRLTVQLPQKLIKKIKMKSIETNQTIKETCEKALNEYIENHTESLS